MRAQNEKFRMQMRIRVPATILALAFSLLMFGQATKPPPEPPAEAQVQNPAPAPMQKPSAQPSSAAVAGQAQPHRRIIVVEPIRVFDPFYDYPYPYAYEPDYMAQNFGYVKLKTDRKDGAVYVDGGYADKIEKAKKFALRPGNHDIEVRNSDNQIVFRKKVQVILGKTTELQVS
jgi:hypothetical protein